MPGEIAVRELVPEESAERYQLSRLAFGGPADPPEEALAPHSDRTRFGAFDSSGRMLGTATDLHHERWWDGSQQPFVDIGGVAVSPEARGRGVARTLLSELLAASRPRGAGLSLLYPTVSGLYRAVGWATVGARRTLDVPTAMLGDARSRPTLAVRAGSAEEYPRVSALAEQTARLRNGPLANLSEGADPPAPPSWLDGLTVVADEQGDLGYLAWERGHGYGEDAVLTVHEFVARTPEAARNLIAVLSSWRSVTPTVRFVAVPSGLLAYLLPLEVAREHRSRPVMARVADAAALVSARRWPAGARGSCTLALSDPLAPWNDGCFELEVEEGSGVLSRTPKLPDATFSIAGLAMLACGTAGLAMLVEAGLATITESRAAGLLAQLSVTPPLELLDYF